MKTFVFVGPTLSSEDAQKELEATYLPPAAQGDVLDAAREKPWAIGMIDGYFHRVPAVWHKEILWAMSKGIHVFGSASMGALRAAELAVFGMRGIGKIFEDFQSRRLEDDDEVALVHGQRKDGFRPGSEAMVNLRYTLDHAVHAGVLDAEGRAALIEIGKSLHYPERSYRRLLASAADRKIFSPAALETLAAWIPTNKIDQKRRDAVAMLRHMASMRQGHPEANAASFTFQRTDAWMGLFRRSSFEPGEAQSARSEAWLEELRLRGESAYEMRRAQTLARLLALELDELQGGDGADPAAVLTTTSRFCGERALHTPDALEAWVAEHGLSRDAFYRLMEDETRLTRQRLLRRSKMAPHWRDQSRLAGDHSALVDRSQAKQRRLEDHGLSRPDLADSELTETQLWAWYFEEHLGQAIPDDLGAYARRLDYRSPDHLRREILREYCFLRLEQEARNTVADPLLGDGHELASKARSDP